MQHLILTICTLNVLQTGHQGKARYAAIEAELAALGADVVTLQEVRRLDTRRTSADALLPGYHRAVGGRYRGYHLAILSRHPIVRTVEVPFENNRRRMALGAVLDVHGRQVLVMTTHLDYQLRHHRQRRAQLEAIFAEAARFDGPVILTGDFNFGDGEPEEAAIPAAWVDAWRALHPAKPGYTWDNAKNPMANAGKLQGEPSRRLDRVLVRQGRAVSAALAFTRPVRGELYPSDHFGVVAQVALTP